jgi:hypothetical protein
MFQIIHSVTARLALLGFSLFFSLSLISRIILLLTAHHELTWNSSLLGVFACGFGFDISAGLFIWTQEVLENLFESYPMVPILSGIVSLGTLVIWVLKRKGVFNWAAAGTNSWADHCAGKPDLDVTKFHIPAMIYNPKFLTKEKVGALIPVKTGDASSLAFDTSALYRTASWLFSTGRLRQSFHQAEPITITTFPKQHVAKPTMPNH